MSAVLDRARGLFGRREDDVVVHCPNDDWDFRPRYTDGVCPLDGWRPPGVDTSPPWAAEIDWFWPSMIFLGIVSVVMAVAVIVVYVRA